MRATDTLTYSPPRNPAPADLAELSALARHVKAGRCALFVGAGLSAPAGLPTWGALMQQLIDRATPWAVDPALFSTPIDFESPVRSALKEPRVAAVRRALGDASFRRLCDGVRRVRGGSFDLQELLHVLDTVYQDSADRAELARLTTQRRYTELAEHCRTRLGRERFHAIVRDALTTTAELPSTHVDIVRTPYSCVVTTNFDTLLEDAYARYAGFVPRTPTGAELGQQGTLLLDEAFFILKAHGDAARPETMVFTADDYRRIIHATPAFQAVLGGILLTHAVLFVGYSLNDVNFRLLLDNQLTVFNGHVPPRYALLSGVGPAEADLLWQTAKLQVLSYPDGQHDQVGKFLGQLAEESAPRSLLATKRVRTDRSSRVATLRIDSDGSRVIYELTDADGGKPWIGSGRHPDTHAIGTWLRNADQQAGRGHSPRALVQRIGKALAASLPDDLQRRLSHLPAGQTLELACSTQATRIPWEWLDAGGQELAMKRPCVRRPVGVSHQARGRRQPGAPLRALVLGDAGDAAEGQGMPHLFYADLEARVIARLLETRVGATVTCLSREQAVHARVMDEIERGQYDIIHFAGHAWFDDREAYFYTWDRIILGSELAPLLTRSPPALLVLDTHYTAFVISEVDARTRDLVGTPTSERLYHAEGPRGFADAAMRCGVSSFVGAFGTVTDLPAAELMVDFYERLLKGRTVAEALLDARQMKNPLAADSGLFYTAVGYPDFGLTRHRHKARHPLPSVASLKRDVGWPAA